jgi:hypothetical protein
MAGPEKADEQGKHDHQPRSGPPGDFLSADFESDCARFIDEAKERARRRAEAGRRELGPPGPRPS